MIASAARTVPNTAAAAGVSSAWNEYVWMARGVDSRLWEKVRSFMIRVDQASREIKQAAPIKLEAERRYTLARCKAKHLIYAAMGLRDRSAKYDFVHRRVQRNAFSWALTRGADEVAKGELTAMMTRCGSDKGRRVHNYTGFYQVLFGDDRKRIKRVCEVGVGTNNPDIPSNMGERGVPGASLRGWREYFPRADVFGGDIDSRILFREERIVTGYVDQTRPGSIRRFFDSIGADFDIILDDGLHDLAANRTLFLTSWPYLRPGGVYVIEDIRRAVSDLHRQYLTDYDSVILEIPHRRNFYDNCIAAVVKE